jgi:hypothetical protein
MAFFDIANVLSVKFAMKIFELVSKSLILSRCIVIFNVRVCGQ